MAFTLDGHTSNQNSNNPCTANLTTSNSGVRVVVQVTYYKSSGLAGMTESVTLGGVAMTQRGAIHLDQSGTRGQSIWWADAASPLSSAAIVANPSIASTTETSIVAFGAYNGGATIAWDSNASLPAAANGTSGNPSVSGVSTTGANDLLLGFILTQGGNAVTAGSGFTLVASSETVPNTYSEYQAVSSTQSGISVGATVSSTAWVMVADALTTGGGGGTAVTADAPSPIGILAGLVGDELLPAEADAGQLQHVALWDESLALQRGDEALIFAGLGSQRADGGALAEVSTGQKIDASARAEWSGAIGVTADGFAPIETTARLLRDAALAAETLGLAKVDLLALAGILAGARGDLALTAEMLGNLSRDVQATIESTGAVNVSVTADAAAEFEFLARASIDPQALAEWTGDTALVIDALAPIEWLAIPPAALIAIGVGRLLRSPGRRRLLRQN